MMSETQQTIIDGAIAAVKQLGVATVILFCGGWWICNHVGDPIVNAYTANIASQADVMRKQAATLDELATIARQQADQHKVQIDLLQAIQAGNSSRKPAT